ncbi:U3 small nucleolar ribonucleoprotein complex, subunit Mpp10 [Collybia nuda]|uniref:U3 small nucleolar ribonucleoprotein protein MPP10 n=1 Tax=Collybia nuda TaxID=64659 RepID=A0A9P5Y2A5_9AGAR|nr:U3 small nucleolar ribonucleoprotein complex, subunit Mpp10 [Collybia nuda]
MFRRKQDDLGEQKTQEISAEIHKLSRLIDRHPEYFVLGSLNTSATALKATKDVFDISIQSEPFSKSPINNLISSLEPSHAPETRSQAGSTGKRKRSPTPTVNPKITFKITPLPSLFVDGMTEDQVWAQLDLRTKNICAILDLALNVGVGEGEEHDVEDMSYQDEIIESDDRDETNLNDALNQKKVNRDIYDHSSFDRMEQGRSGRDEGMVNLQNASLSTSSNDSEDNEGVVHQSNTSIGFSEKRLKTNELNDGFFDLALFNAETERAEAMSSSNGQLGGSEESDDDDMSLELFAPSQVENTEDSEVFYRDFFEPPSLFSKPGLKRTFKMAQSTPGRVRFHDEVRVREIHSSVRNPPAFTADEGVKEDGNVEDAGDVEEIDNIKPDIPMEDFTDSDEEDGMDENEQGRQVMARLKGDLFEVDEDDRHYDMSTHEKRLAGLQAEISQLESANVGPKDWMLMGEADTRARPQNSLLEEDLEFERVMKAVPVITEENVHILEERIKSRIIEGRFDDVARIRPVEDKAFLPSRFFEMSDKKSVQSLAQIYENEFTMNHGGNTMGEDRDGKLYKEHLEIEYLWESICGKLDALCNTHFVPKQAKAIISTIFNVSTATLESALPTTKSTADMFAPEEIFAPVSNDPRVRSELTPSEKRSLRTKMRKEKKKSRDILDHSVDKYAKTNSVSGMKRQKRAALESVVKKGKGVTVVGKVKNLLVKQDLRTTVM